jgi:hypothetical protein
VVFTLPEKTLPRDSILYQLLDLRSSSSFGIDPPGGVLFLHSWMAPELGY